MQIYFGKDKVVVLKSRQGFEVHILTLGAVVQKLLVPDRKGVFSDVVLGFDTLGPYKVNLLAPIHFPPFFLSFRAVTPPPPSSPC